MKMELKKMELNMYDLQAINLMKADARRTAAAYRLNVAKQLGNGVTDEELDRSHNDFYAEVLAEALANTFPEMGDEEVESLVQDAVAELRPPED